MTLKELINNFRNDNSNKVKYGEFLQKLFDMHNNDETLMVLGRIVQEDGKENITMVRKRLEDENYILLFTEDADAIPKLMENKNNYMLMAIKVKVLFDVLLNGNDADGFIFNDGDGEGNVMLAKENLQMIINMQ